MADTFSEQKTEKESISYQNDEFVMSLLYYFNYAIQSVMFRLSKTNFLTSKEVISILCDAYFNKKQS